MDTQLDAKPNPVARRTRGPADPSPLVAVGREADRLRASARPPRRRQSRIEHSPPSTNRPRHAVRRTPLGRGPVTAGRLTGQASHPGGVGAISACHRENRVRHLTREKD